MNLALFGFKASGKTHFGKLLASHLHRPFVDLDDLIIELYTEKTGKRHKIKQIYKLLGASEFRSLEHAAIQSLKNVDNSIIALGGGTVLDKKNVELLMDVAALVYLKAGAEKLKKRIFQDELPSFFNPKNPEESFWEMIQEREPIYRSIPASCVDTDLLDEPGVIAKLNSILLLEERPNGL